MLVADAATLAADHVLTTLERVFGAVEGREVLVYDRDRSPTRGGTADRARLARLGALRQLTSAHGAWLIVGGRADLAVAVGAEGVQLPEAGLPAERVIATWPDLAVGRSCHDRDGLVAAAEAGCDWATLAPVRRPWTPKSPSGPPLGVDGFAAAVQGLPLPVFALGGVGADLAGALRGAGAWGLATIGWVFAAPDPAERARALVAGRPN